MSDDKTEGKREERKAEGKKVGFYISHELDDRLNRVIPWGMKASVHKCLLEIFADAAEDKGGVVVHKLLSGELTLMDATSIQHMNDSNSHDKNDKAE